MLESVEDASQKETINICLATGCLLNIVFFLKMLWFFWILQVLLQRWCVYTHCHREKTEKGKSPDILKSSKKHNFSWTPCTKFVSTSCFNYLFFNTKHAMTCQKKRNYATIFMFIAYCVFISGKLSLGKIDDFKYVFFTLFTLFLCPLPDIYIL